MILVASGVVHHAEYLLEPIVMKPCWFSCFNLSMLNGSVIWVSRATAFDTDRMHSFAIPSLTRASTTRSKLGALYVIGLYRIVSFLITRYMMPPLIFSTAPA